MSVNEGEQALNLHDLSGDGSKFFITVNGKYGASPVDFSCNMWPSTYSQYKIEAIKRETDSLTDSSFNYFSGVQGSQGVKDVSFDMSLVTGSVDACTVFYVKQGDKSVNCLTPTTAGSEISHELGSMIFYNLYDTAGGWYQKMDVIKQVTMTTDPLTIPAGGYFRVHGFNPDGGSTNWQQRIGLYTTLANAEADKGAYYYISTEPADTAGINITENDTPGSSDKDLIRWRYKQNSSNMIHTFYLSSGNDRTTKAVKYDRNYCFRTPGQVFDEGTIDDYAWRDDNSFWTDGTIDVSFESEIDVRVVKIGSFRSYPNNQVYEFYTSPARSTWTKVYGYYYPGEFKTTRINNLSKPYYTHQEWHDASSGRTGDYKYLLHLGATGNGGGAPGPGLNPEGANSNDGEDYEGTDTDGNAVTFTYGSSKRAHTLWGTSPVHPTAFTVGADGIGRYASDTSQNNVPTYVFLTAKNPLTDSTAP